MSRYYFDIDNGTGRFRDDSGTNRQDDDAAAIEAVQILEEVLRDDVGGLGSLRHRLVCWVRRGSDDTAFLRITMTMVAEKLQ